MTLMPRGARRWRRYAWLGTLLVLGGLYALVLITLVRTENPNLVPSVILLGATVVPVSFLVFAEGRSGRWQVSPAVLAGTAFIGGVIGVVVAGWLEWDALRSLGTLPMLFVAVIEETAKLVVPVIILVATLSSGRRDPADGLVIGVASGVGFAALETMGYAFTALLSSKGGIGAVEQTLFLRGVLAPAGHIAWTGLTAGALWALAARPGGRRLAVFAGTFAGAIALHTLWDSIGAVLAYAVLGLVSVGWLLIAMRRYRTFATAVDRAPAVH
ncbi:PrsW family intramembrane metalloprotease [Catenuloplanes indicus]|uniref:RsiW-degrading membrane proteinase PrsW (M82 family) n=1 Tax=Catenuloplanes indicus TaxID=137267 RepID=A0AAE4B3R1_9ACTN|nr:PrsW family glutamic-type intramembrane protease [Catenuloplanes indicus]MDQ0370458.1 RsiW-degrading membrane proteinase PrsW (M82 family) [Catenuloplanes indicus]